MFCCFCSTVLLKTRVKITVLGTALRSSLVSPEVDASVFENEPLLNLTENFAAGLAWTTPFFTFRLSLKESSAILLEPFAPSGNLFVTPPASSTTAAWLGLKFAGTLKLPLKLMLSLAGLAKLSLICAVDKVSGPMLGAIIGCPMGVLGG